MVPEPQRAQSHRVCSDYLQVWPQNKAKKKKIKRNQKSCFSLSFPEGIPPFLENNLFFSASEIMNLLPKLSHFFFAQIFKGNTMNKVKVPPPH